MGFARKYDRAITESEDGQRLYAYWLQTVKKNTDSPEFQTYPGFYKWSMDAGYSADASLFRRDAKAPYSPENCAWIGGEKKVTHRDFVFEQKWDETVNRIRRYYGMEPIHSTMEVEDCG